MVTPYYQHAGMTIYHGDCRDILPSLQPVELVLTDPPYSISITGAKHIGPTGKGVRRLDFFACDADWAKMTATVVQAISAAALLVRSLYVWLGHRQIGAVVDALEMLGFSTRFLVWSKLVVCPAAPGAELCVYGYKPGRTWTPSPATNPVSNVIVADNYRHGQPGKLPHPTQKPLSLFNKLVTVSSNEGDTVLDPFMGSGTALRAAKDLGRKAIGIEIEEKYCEIAAKRLSQEVFDYAGDER